MSSLLFIKNIMTDFDISYCMVMGTYRNTDVDDTHPLVITLKEN